MEIYGVWVLLIKEDIFQVPNSNLNLQKSWWESGYHLNVSNAEIIDSGTIQFDYRS